MPRPLWLFSLVNLVIGTGAFVIGGILAPLAADLGIGVPAAGQAMTAYALSTALLGPPWCCWARGIGRASTRCYWR